MRKHKNGELTASLSQIEKRKTTTYKKMQRFLKRFKKIAALVLERLYWSDNALVSSESFSFA
jgi:hypothetical protein